MEPAEEFVRLPVLYDSWSQLKDNLSMLASEDIRGIVAFEEVLQRNDRWENIQLPMSLLRGVLKEEGGVCTLEHFSSILMPWIAKTALQVEQLFKDFGYKLQLLFCMVKKWVCTIKNLPSSDVCMIPSATPTSIATTCMNWVSTWQDSYQMNRLLRLSSLVTGQNLHAGRTGEVLLTRRQVCCLLCLAFFNSFEPQPGNYQQFTLANYFSFGMSKSQRSKLLCVLNYFERIRKAEEAKEEDFMSMCVTVSRRCLDPTEAKKEVWIGCEKPLLQFESLTEEMIENAHGCLQMDFANEYIGGGVLGMGCVQEEIRFVINPECLVSILFCEAMTELESILIVGAEQFSDYTGYGTNLAYAGPHVDTNLVDDCKRRSVSIVAIDAIPFGYSGDGRQFEEKNILRELNKAYSGFTSTVRGDRADAMTPVATGNWGCGAFGGNKSLKTIIQWMAASRAGRSVKYSTFKDTKLSERQTWLTEKLLSKELTVSELYKILLLYAKEDDLFDFVASAVQ